MRERAEDVGGTLEDVTDVESGITVTLRIPDRNAYTGKASEVGDAGSLAN